MSIVNPLYKEVILQNTSINFATEHLLEDLGDRFIPMPVLEGLLGSHLLELKDMYVFVN